MHVLTAKMFLNTFKKEFITTIILCILLNNLQIFCEASPPNNRQIENNHVRNNRVRYPTRSIAQTQYSRVRQEPFPDFLGDDDDLFDMIKRQSDDYGHMRFGKRDFDDYGHMRFGKSIPEN